MALAVLLIGPGLGPTGCDGLTGIDDLTFERGVDSFCGPEIPCPEDTFCDLTSASCQPKQNLGTVCSRIDECRSGRCVNGVCCNGPCNASCLACDLPGSEGLCRVVPDGDDPHDQCPGTTSCGPDGACQGRCLWGWADGDSGTDVAVDVAVFEDLGDPEDRNDDRYTIYVLGTFEGTLKGPLISKGGTDVFLTKLSPEGHPLWSQSFGSTEADTAVGLAVDDDDNVVVAANFAGPVTIGATEDAIDGVDAALIKLDGEGNLLWHVILGYPNNPAALTTATDVTVDPQGNVVATGHFTGGIYYDPTHLALGSAYADVFVVKMDAAQGSWLWNLELGGGDTYPLQGGAVAVGRDDGVILTMVGRGAVTLPNETLNGSTEDDDLFMVRLDGATGVATWGLPFAGPDDQQPGGLTIHPGEASEPDTVWLAGAFADELDIPNGAELQSQDDRDGFFALLDATDGSPGLSGALTGPFDEVPQAVAINGTGNATIIGHFEALLEGPDGSVIQATGGTDVFVVKLDSEGEVAWTLPFGGTLADQGLSVATDTPGHVVAVGYFEHTIDFGCAEPLEAVGDSDFFVVKLAP